MKVIFLDIDGVLKEEDYDAEFKDECFARLKKIIDATDAQIILSSSWRISYWEFVENGFQTDSKQILDLYRHFEKYDIKISGRTGYTERSGPESRPAEIRKWLAAEPEVETFFIIDDDDFYCWKWLSQFLVITRVQTNDDERITRWKRTLSDADVNKAIEILNRDNKGMIKEQFTP